MELYRDLDRIGQPLDGLLELTPQLGVLQRGMRRGAHPCQGGSVRKDQLVELRATRGALPSGDAGAAEGPVAGDRRQPGREACRVVQLRQRLEREQEGFLGNVLGTFGGNAAGNAHHGRAEATNQFVEGGELPQRGGQHERVVVQVPPASVLHP